MCQLYRRGDGINNDLIAANKNHDTDANASITINATLPQLFLLSLLENTRGAQ